MPSLVTKKKRTISKRSTNDERRTTNDGFTLLEVMIAIVLFGVGIVAVVSLLSSGMAGALDAENTAIAVNLAQERMEEIRNLTYANIVNEAKAVVTGFSVFQREVVVTEPETNLKQVTVTVYWTHKGGEAEVPLVSYVAAN
ncbi:MAG: prepilin-type N-terminal cleavage/methylation domain-containing protein [Omnitrophica bacterium]|nr:prepilin-type N-terminal cleavage/methylation domain-containing protein [Candidatus Omnitrophota bacterium]